MLNMNTPIKYVRKARVKALKHILSIFYVDHGRQGNTGEPKILLSFTNYTSTTTSKA